MSQLYTADEATIAEIKDQEYMDYYNTYRDNDVGDFRYCSACKEWTIQEVTTETTAEHKIINRFTCQCGAESEEV